MNTVKVAQRTVGLPNGMSSCECIRLMAREAAELWYPGRGEELAAAALEREQAEPTCLGYGLAVPHARVTGLPGAAVYVAKGDGLSWSAEAVDCVALLCVPAELPELHLQLLSRVVRWRMKGGELCF